MNNIDQVYVDEIKARISVLEEGAEFYIKDLFSNEEREQLDQNFRRLLGRKVSKLVIDGEIPNTIKIQEAEVKYCKYRKV